MVKTRLFPLVFLLFFLYNCSNDVTAPSGNEFPEKLSPYETFYDAATFKQRRDALMSKLPGDALAVITTNDAYLRTGDAVYEFRPAFTFFLSHRI